MTDEIMDYQEEMAEEALEDSGPEQTFATIGAVYSDGVSLLFDGEDEPSAKHYKVNTFFKYSAGQRVYIAKDSGTYVVLCAIGRPTTSIRADSAGTASGVGSSSSYGGTCYVQQLMVGSPSSHWIITAGAIYHSVATESKSAGLIGGYVNYDGGNVYKRPVNYINVKGTLIHDT